MAKTLEAAQLELNELRTKLMLRQEEAAALRSAVDAARHAEERAFVAGNDLDAEQHRRKHETARSKLDGLTRAITVIEEAITRAEAQLDSVKVETGDADQHFQMLLRRFEHGTAELAEAALLLIADKKPSELLRLMGEVIKAERFCAAKRGKQHAGRTAAGDVVQSYPAPFHQLLVKLAEFEMACAPELEELAKWRAQTSSAVPEEHPAHH